MPSPLGSAFICILNLHDVELCRARAERHGPARQTLVICRLTNMNALPVPQPPKATQKAVSTRAIPTRAIPTRAWVRMPSGKRLDLLNPTPLDWEDEDLALGLARTYRWGGHSAWPLPLSVAQHSLLVLALRRQEQRRDDPRRDLRELLHDADEGLLGFDCISVVKPFLGESFAKLTKQLQAAVFLRYGLVDWTPTDYRKHKKADRVAAASEAVHVVGWTVEEVHETLRIPHEVLSEDPLAALYGEKPWEPWAPTVAAERFLAELSHLLKAVH